MGVIRDKSNHWIVEKFFEILKDLEFKSSLDEPNTLFYEVSDGKYIILDRWNNVYKFVEDVEEPHHGWKH